MSPATRIALWIVGVIVVVAVIVGVFAWPSDGASGSPTNGGSQTATPSAY